MWLEVCNPRRRWTLRFPEAGRCRGTPPLQLRRVRPEQVQAVRRMARLAAPRVRRQVIRGQGADWEFPSIRRVRMTRGRSIRGGFWVGWDWQWLWVRESC